MTNSIIIIPRSKFLDSDRVMPTLGPLYLKSFLESKGHLVDIDDSPDINNLPNLERYNVIGISSTTPQYFAENGGKDIAKKIKEKYPDKKLIIGGAHAKNYFNELVNDNIFDHIVRGDGERAFLDILEGKNLALVVNYPQLKKEEIDSFPIPWRDKDYLSKYKYNIFGKRATTAITGRYCPMQCKFCEERGSGLVLYSAQKVKEDLEAIKKAGFEALMFYDDIFSISEKRIEELCDIIKSLDLTFRCNGHAKIMSRNKEVLQKLKEAGCVEICIGIESGDQKILDIIEKGNKIEECFSATKNILNEGLKISAYLMIGLPGENKETIANTEKYIAQFSDNPNFTFDLTIFYPYRHSYIRENINEFDLNLHLEGSKGLYKGAGGASECCVSTSALSREDIIAERERLINKYKNNFRGVVKK